MHLGARRRPSWRCAQTPALSASGLMVVTPRPSSRDVLPWGESRMHLDARRRPSTSMLAPRSDACALSRRAHGPYPPAVFTWRPSLGGEPLAPWCTPPTKHFGARAALPSTSVPAPRTDACASPSGHIVTTPQLSQRRPLGKEPQALQCMLPTKHFGARSALLRLCPTFGRWSQ